MDRSRTSEPECSAAMRTARRASLDLLSPATAGERGEPASAPAPRRAVPGWPVFRQPSHGRHAGGQPQTHPARDAPDRTRPGGAAASAEPAVAPRAGGDAGLQSALVQRQDDDRLLERGFCVDGALPPSAGNVITSLSPRRKSSASAVPTSRRALLVPRTPTIRE